MKFHRFPSKSLISEIPLIHIIARRGEYSYFLDKQVLQSVGERAAPSWAGTLALGKIGDR